jgi:3-deoxy-D-manno-octulosonic-acid transferase
MASDLRPKSRLIDRAAGNLVAGAINLTYRTSSPPPLWDDHIEIFRGLHPFILALWHGQFMLLPALPRDDIPTRVMLALHRDAELMAHAMRKHDLELIRGAGAGIRGKDRGGAQAFRAAASSLAQGYTVAMTADVPPGPARRCGNGIITLARVSGRPILPVALASSRYISLKTWSRMTINLPGSKLGGSIGDVIRVPADATADDLEKYRLQVEQQLDIATADAYARAGVSADRATPPHALDVGNGPTRPGRGLRAYRAVTQFARPLAPVILRYRARRDKEEPARRNERFGIANISRPSGTLVWLHAASVGETNAILPLIDELQRARLNILLTTGTVTSARLAAARLSGNAIHQYLPLDVPDYVRGFLEHWKPDLGVFTESEIWPNLVIAAADREIPLAIVNGRLSKKSFRGWRKRPGLALPLFSRFNLVMAQNKLFELRFSQLGARHVMAYGNLKVDAPPPPVDAALKAELTSLIGTRPVWLAASTHADEERMMADAHKTIAATHASILTIIAPRHPARGPEIAAALKASGLQVCLRSSGRPLDAATDIYIADTLGEIGTLFALCPLTFMGKSLIADGGGHNPIEPIRLGSGVITGPRWHNFEDAFKALLPAGGAIEVKSAIELGQVIARLLSNTNDMAKLRSGATKALSSLSGALPLTRDALLKLLPTDAATAANRGRPRGTV